MAVLELKNWFMDFSGFNRLREFSGAISSICYFPFSKKCSFWNELFLCMFL